MRFFDKVFVRKATELDVIKEGARSKPRITAMAAERGGKLQFVLRRSAWTFFAASVDYQRYSREEALKLRDALSQFEAVWQRFEDDKQRGS